MWIFWIILLVVIGVALMIYATCTADRWQGVAGMWCIVFLTDAAIIANHYINPKPTALDVYRGNTELQITSVNGMPTDSVVVFKNNIY